MQTDRTDNSLRPSSSGGTRGSGSLPPGFDTAASNLPVLGPRGDAGAPLPLKVVGKLNSIDVWLLWADWSLRLWIAWSDVRYRFSFSRLVGRLMHPLSFYLFSFTCAGGSLMEKVRLWWNLIPGRSESCFPWVRRWKQASGFWKGSRLYLLCYWIVWPFLIGILTIRVDE